MSTNEYYVVGSGPAGCACALGLLENGCSVTMLDIGTTLPNTATQNLQGFRNEPQKRQQIFDCNKLYRYLKQGKKLLYGSEFPYNETDHHTQQLNTRITSSSARGGLSNVWGASLSTYTKEAFDDWPIDYDCMTTHYQKLAEHIKPAYGIFDHHQNNFYDKDNKLKLSEQATWLATRWRQQRYSLKLSGLEFHTPRLAVNFKSCHYCGSCLYGCPDHLIYSSNQMLDTLLTHKNFTYLNNHHVSEIKDRNDGVDIICHNNLLHGKKVYLACGPLQTAKILINSGVAQHATFQDSQYFNLPALLFKRFKSASKSPYHTLCQALLRLKNLEDKGLQHSIQLYTYMDFIDLELKHKLGPLSVLAKPLRDRLIILQGYLHGDISASMTLQKTDSGFTIKAYSSQETYQAIQKICSTLLAHKKALGFFAIKPLIAIGKPGDSKHYGASFPMGAHQHQNTSDQLGRPNQCINTHIVDASVLPKITAQSPTFTIMANAHRIAKESCL